MDIHTAAHYMKCGYRVTRSSWESGRWISERLLSGAPIDFTLSDLIADDWEVITTGIISDFPLEYEE